MHSRPWPQILVALVGMSWARGSATEFTVPTDFSTIQQALNAAQPGDTVKVRPGTYAENLRFDGKDIALLSTDGPAVTILNANRSRGVEIGPGGQFVGFTVTNAYETFGAAMSVSGVGTVIRGNVFDGNVQSGGGYGAAIGGNNASPVIEGNVFRHQVADDQLLAGAVSFVNDSSPRIVNNLFVSNQCAVINFTLPEGSRPTVLQNTLVGNRVAVRYDRRVPAGLLTYRNNLIACNTVGLRVDFGTDAQSAVWEHNLVFGNGTDYLGLANPTGSAGNLSANPLLYDAVAGDFHLRQRSPAVDAGSPAGAPTNDFENVLRPLDGDGDGTRVVDIGAYEFQLTVPRPPTGLAAVSGDHVVMLTWNAVVDVTSYDVKRATNSGGPYTVVGSALVPSYTDTNVVNDVAYYYLVTARNSVGESAGSVELMIQPGNLPPVPGPDFGTTLEDTPLVLNVLTNDVDPNGDLLSILAAGQPPNGLVTLTNGLVAFYPAPDFNGTNSFSFVVSDDRGGSGTGTVSIVVLPVNDPPVGTDQFVNVPGDEVAVFRLEAHDPEDDPLTVQIVTPPVNGRISALASDTGEVTYVPPHGFVGSDTFTFRVSDGVATSSVARVTIAVASLRDADRDGIPDYWETLHDINNPEGDRDRDGLTNQQEYLANTDPRDGASVLAVSSIRINDQGYPVVSWQSVGGSRYRVQRAPGDAQGGFKGAFSDIVLPALLEIDPAPIGVPSTMSLTDDAWPGPVPKSCFYRVRVVFQ